MLYHKVMRCLWPCLTLVVLGLTAAAQARDVPKPWKETYAKISKTIVENDVPAYMKWMDRSFINIQDGKRTGFDEYQKMFTTFLKPFKNIKAEAKPLTYAMKGKDVVIAFRYTFSGDVTKDGKTKTLRFFEDGVDTWSMNGGKWLQRAEEIKKQGLLPAKSA